MIDFKVQLEMHLKRKGVSVAKLSRMIDVSQGTLYKYLQGKTSIGSHILQKCFNALNSLENKN